MPSIRICVVMYDPYFFEGTARRLAEAARDAGYSVDVICTHRSDEKRYEVYEGVHIYRMPMSRDFGLPIPIMFLNWCWFLLLAGITVTFLHLKRAYDVIHVHNMPDFLVFSALLPKLLGAKVILHVQDITPELMFVKVKGPLRGVLIWLAIWQERISTTLADHVITVGEPFAASLQKRAVPREKLTIIANSADPKFFPPSRRSITPFESSKGERPFILMYHGTLAERFGVDTAIRALALARRVVPKLHLHIKGHGELLPVLKKIAVELGVSDSVEFSDVCPLHEIVDFVEHGDVGIIPYRCDGFADLSLPTKAFEFAWMHRPMIASDMRGLRSVFRPESIAMCDSTSPPSFAAAIVDLYQHPEKRACMAANAAEDYISYRWELMRERYQQLLAWLCRKQVGGRHLHGEELGSIGE